MNTRPLRLLATVVAVAASAPVVATPAYAAGTPGYCPDANGVTVVVDYHELGGGVVIRCAPGGQASGLAALENAGFTVTGTVRWGKGFVCRINGKPGVDTEPCVDTPPASAYWSYWHAPNGGAWTYSSLGVLNRRPPPGSFEGWSFSSGRSGSNAPPPGAAPRRPVPPPATTRPAPTTRPPTGRGAGPGPTGGGAPVVSPAAVSPAPTRPANPTDLTASSGSSTGGPAPDGIAATPPSGGTAPLGSIAGVVLVLAALAAVAVNARRRRGTDPGG